MLNRDGLIAQLFASCDADGDGRLSMDELRTFAELTGFKSGEQSWSEAFTLLCAERNVDPATGFDIDEWSALISDEDECNACLCSNSDIVRIMLMIKCEQMVKDEEIVQGEEFEQDRRMRCNKGHRLEIRSLGVLEGRVNPSKCSVCHEVIFRKEARYSCKTCRYNVCSSCYGDQHETPSSDASSTDVPSCSDGELSTTPDFQEQWSYSLRNLQSIQVS